MDYRETSCSAAIKNVRFLGDCFDQNKQSNKVLSYYNATSPLPLQKTGNGTISPTRCDCTSRYTNNDSGSNWGSDIINNTEYWQSGSNQMPNPKDMLTVQTFESGSKIDLGNCFNYGFKNVASRRSWHGDPGFVYRDDAKKDNKIIGINFITGAFGVWYWDNTPMGFNGFVTESFNPTQTKYLRVDETISTYDYDVVCYTWHDTVKSSSYAGSSEVGVNTGIVTAVSPIFNPVYNYNCYDPLTFGNYLDAINGLTKNGLIEHFASWYPVYLSSANNWSASFTQSGNIYTANIQYSTPYPGFINYRIETKIDIDNGDFYRKYWIMYIEDVSYACFTYAAGVYNLIYTQTAHLDNTTFNYTYDDYYYYGDNEAIYSGQHKSHNTLIASWSKPNTINELLNDITSSLNYWPLDDNAIYPWRHDSYTSFLPLVQRREVQSNVSPTGMKRHYADDPNDYRSPVFDGGDIVGYASMSWVDPNSIWWDWYPNSQSIYAQSTQSMHYDGQIIGKPYITGSKKDGTYGLGWGWFDFYYNDIHTCKTPSGCGATPPYQLWSNAYGASLADAIVSVCNDDLVNGPQMSNILPMETTHWVNNSIAHNIPRGANISCNVIDQGMWATKWAETRVAAPSYNHFRLCGLDRIAIDETTAVCFSDDLVMYGNLPDSISSSILLAFTNGYDGIYSGSSQVAGEHGSYNLTLGNKICDLPSDYYHPFADWFNEDTLGCAGLVGIIRWPDNIVCPICGRQQIIVNSTGGGTTASFTTGQTNLRTGDKIDLYTKAWQTASFNCPVTRSSDTTYYINKPFIGSITSSIWAMSSGAPDYHWNDVGEKMDYRYAQWFTSQRTASLNTNSSCNNTCSRWSPCGEQVICFSPNNETFTNGMTRWFTDTFQADDIFGDIMQYNAEFSIIDPLYQTPKVPCNINNIIALKAVEDDGQCKDDYINQDDPLKPVQIIFYPPAPRVEAMCNTASMSPTLPQGLTWPCINVPGAPGASPVYFHLPLEPWNRLANEIANNKPSCRFNPFYYGA